MVGPKYEKIGNFVCYYNNLDVTGMVKGIEKMSEIYHSQGFNIFKDVVSLPRLTQKFIFKPLKDDYLITFSKMHQHIYEE